MPVKVTSKYKTIAVLPFVGPVSIRNCNPAAHGGVKLCQARRSDVTGLLYGRYVNSNGRHQEVGAAFFLEEYTLAYWQRIGSKD